MCPIAPPVHTFGCWLLYVSPQRATVAKLFTPLATHYDHVSARFYVKLESDNGRHASPWWLGGWVDVALLFLSVLLSDKRVDGRTRRSPRKCKERLGMGIKSRNHNRPLHLLEIKSQLTCVAAWVG